MSICSGLRRELTENHSLIFFCLTYLSISSKLTYNFFILNFTFYCFCFARKAQETKLIEKNKLYLTHYGSCLLTPKILCALSMNHTYLFYSYMYERSNLNRIFIGLSNFTFFAVFFFFDLSQSLIKSHALLRTGNIFVLCILFLPKPLR